MRSEKYGQLIDRLIAKTNRGELDWKEGVYPKSFQVSFPKYSLVLRERDYTADFGREITITMLDMFGKVIDTISNLEVDAEGAEKPYRRRMADLFMAVRQQAFRADKAVEEILSELGE